MIPSGRSCPEVLKIKHQSFETDFVYATITPYGGPFQGPSTIESQILYFVHSQGMKCVSLTTPHSFFDVIALQMWFRLFPVRSPLLRECATTAIRFSAFGHQKKLITES